MAHFCFVGKSPQRQSSGKNLVLRKADGMMRTAKCRIQIPMELLGKSKDELRAFCVALGEPAFRGAQIYHALYSEKKFDVAQITNLPSALRERLGKEARIALPELKKRFHSSDGSVRYLFALPPGESKE